MFLIGLFQSVESTQVLPTGPVLAFECLWRGCDYQYEDLQDLKIHLLDSTCHLRKSGTVIPSWLTDDDDDDDEMEDNYGVVDCDVDEDNNGWEEEEDVLTC